MSDLDPRRSRPGFRERICRLGLPALVRPQLECPATGCDLIGGMIDGITGGANGGGSGDFGAVVSGRLVFHPAAYITKSEGCSEPGTVGTTFFSSGGTYAGATKTFTATWDAGDSSNTIFEVRLNPADGYIEYFHARQVQANVWGARRIRSSGSMCPPPWPAPRATASRFVSTTESVRERDCVFSAAARRGRGIGTRHAAARGTWRRPRGRIGIRSGRGSRRSCAPA